MKRTMYRRGFGLFIIAILIGGSDSYLIGRNTNSEVLSRVYLQLMMDVHRVTENTREFHFVFIIV